MQHERTIPRLFLLVITAMAILLVSSCYKDKGNYIYKVPAAPVVTGLDSTYNVYVGDSLVIKPVVSLPGSGAQLTYLWTIHVPPVNPGDTNLVYSGRELHIVFGLGPKQFTARYTITNMDNGMKYFRDFRINGETAFSTGTTVLTNENGVAMLSFIKPDDSVQPRIYEAVNPGEALPGDPNQLLAVPVAYQTPIASYWVFGKSGINTGVQIDANTFKKIKYLSDNYFDAPDTMLQPERIFVNPLGVITGVINGILFSGTTSTWNMAPTYGMFGQGATGDYKLSPEIVFNYTGTFGPGNYIGFDLIKKQFVRFNLYGAVTYFGPNYNVIGNAFDAKHIDMTLVHLQQINGGLCYAYFRAEHDSLFELEFNAEFNGPFQITAMQKRPFARPELITDTTKWQATQNGIIYFTYQDKIYRYNPTNQDFKILDADFGGKQVTMIKVIDQNTLLAGVDGSLYYLDIKTGNYGNIIKQISGLPGKVTDVAIRRE
ncbi:MAG TPA: PKD-like family lipoprotein [Chitinophagaceae bacterium]|nr:PKD-like family lipoprotein [Chitinophagaceae bacterium]